MENIASGSSSTSNVRVRVGKYELLRNLGSGNTATVKLAIHVDTRRYVAIKIIDKKKFLGKKKKSRKKNPLRNRKIEAIQKEIMIMRMIKHPNVVGVIEVMATKTKIYIVMELVNGSELFDKISQTSSSGMTEDESRRYFQQLMCAVDYIHKRGVAHRDLKPENLMVDNNGLLKVTDFGMSALEGPDGFVQTACGTLQYTAPEVINSEGYEGTKADIWSCGVILFVMNAGYLPFMSDNNDRRAVYNRIIRADYTLPSFFSSRLRALIQRILVPNPNLRISVNEIFEDDWFKQGYWPPTFPLDEDSKHLLADKGEAGPSGTQGPLAMNAFEMFSTFLGYGIVGNFFDQVHFKSEARFISTATTDTISEAVEHASATFGLKAKKRGYMMITNREQAGRQGHLIIVTEISLMSPLVHMIEVRKVGGDTLEFRRFYNELRTRLQASILKAESVDPETYDTAASTSEGASTSTAA